MFKKDYYCLVAGFPDLIFNDNKLFTNGLKFRIELKQQLSEADYKLVEYLFLAFDNQNLINLLFNQKEQHNCHGIFSKKVLEREIIKAEIVPTYIDNFLKWNHLQENKDYHLKKENKLHSLFYEYALSVNNDFLKDWFLFELNTKNILTALNCKQFNYNTKEHLLLLNSSSEVNANLLNNHLKQDLFEEDLPFAEQIFRVAESEADRLDKEKSMDKIKWDYLDEATFFHYFSIEKILSYTIKLLIIERWIKLDKATGIELLNKLLIEFRESLTLKDIYS